MLEGRLIKLPFVCLVGIFVGKKYQLPKNYLSKLQKISTLQRLFLVINKLLFTNALVHLLDEKFVFCKET